MAAAAAAVDYNHRSGGPHRRNFAGAKQHRLGVKTEVNEEELESLEKLRDEVIYKPLPGGTWAQRRAVLTKHSLYFLHLDSPGILDSIPLHEIETVSRHSVRRASLEPEWRGEGLKGQLSRTLQRGRTIRRLSSESGISSSKEHSPEPERASSSATDGRKSRISRFQGRKLSNESSGSRRFSSELNPSTLQPLSPQSEEFPRFGRTESNGSEDSFTIKSKEVSAIMEIKTTTQGFNSGRKYRIGLTTEALCESWVAQLRRESQICIKRELKLSKINAAQLQVRKIYDSTPVQAVVVLLVLSNFGMVVVEAQLKPRSGTKEQKFFDDAEIAFTVVFTFEVLFNLFGSFLWRFLSDGWSLFDFFVVVVSIANLLLSDLPGVNQLRVLRTLRLLMLFRRLSSLRRIVLGVLLSVIPVLQALAIAMVVVSIYATVGVEYFAEADPDGFGTFSRAMYSLFAVIAFGRWRDNVLRPFSDPVEGEGDTLHVGYIAYIYSFVPVTAWILLQVVIAVLLQKFFVESDKDQEREALDVSSESKDSHHVLDPLLLTLCSGFQTYEDFQGRAKSLFELLDVDSEGMLSFDTLHKGLKKLNLNPQIHLSAEDYCDLCKGTLADEMSLEQFQSMLWEHMFYYTQRSVAEGHSLEYSSYEIKSLLLAFKVMLANISKGKGDVDLLMLAAAKGVNTGGVDGLGAEPSTHQLTSPQLRSRLQKILKPPLSPNTINSRPTTPETPGGSSWSPTLGARSRCLAEDPEVPDSEEDLDWDPVNGFNGAGGLSPLPQIPSKPPAKPSSKVASPLVNPIAPKGWKSALPPPLSIPAHQDNQLSAQTRETAPSASQPLAVATEQETPARGTVSQHLELKGIVATLAMMQQEQREVRNELQQLSSTVELIAQSLVAQRGGSQQPTSVTIMPEEVPPLKVGETALKDLQSEGQIFERKASFSGLQMDGQPFTVSADMVFPPAQRAEAKYEPRQGCEVRRWQET